MLRFRHSHWGIWSGHGTSNGDEPKAGLLNVDGPLYGTTYSGGEYDVGTVFSITLSGVDTVLHSFGPGDGAGPQADLINVNGTLYGTTEKGGTDDDGTIFSLSPRSGTDHLLPKSPQSNEILKGRAVMPTYTVFSPLLYAWGDPG
jgi:uncharacterized repeat protein (TIGR03803 family)